MYEITVYDKIINRKWTEYFDSYYLFRKRYMKLRRSKKLFIISHSNLID